MVGLFFVVFFCCFFFGGGGWFFVGFGGSGELYCCEQMCIELVCRCVQL